MELGAVTVVPLIKLVHPRPPGIPPKTLLGIPLDSHQGIPARIHPRILPGIPLEIPAGIPPGIPLANPTRMNKDK